MNLPVSLNNWILFIIFYSFGILFLDYRYKRLIILKSFDSFDSL